MNGIDTRKLKNGTMILVLTKNSFYKLIKKKDKVFTVQGGKKFLEEKEVIFTGSTLGGTMIKLGWIGFGMNMEMYYNKRRCTTSKVFAARLVGDGWEYDMEWDKNLSAMPRIVEQHWME